jgi:CheY-like chemotaxis protein
MKKVLIVDDVNIIREMIKAHLEDHFELALAENAEQAFGKVATFKPDAIVLDVQMPGGMDGNELCKLIKSIEQFKHIYILMVTADWRTVQAEGDEFMADDYTFKPFYGKDILAMVQMGLGIIPQEDLNNVIRIHKQSA